MDALLHSDPFTSHQKDPAQNCANIFLSGIFSPLRTGAFTPSSLVVPVLDACIGYRLLCCRLSLSVGLVFSFPFF